jgi:hypothetical protein
LQARVQRARPHGHAARYRGPVTGGAAGRKRLGGRAALRPAARVRRRWNAGSEDASGWSR